MAHGKCLRCNTRYVWGDRPRLRLAYCPEDWFPLALTSRVSQLREVQAVPKEGPSHTTHTAALKKRLPDGFRMDWPKVDPTAHG